MDSFKEIIDKSGIMDEDYNERLTDKFIETNKLLIEHFFRSCTRWIEKMEELPNDEETKLFVNELKCIDDSSDLEQMIFRIKIPFWFRIQMADISSEEMDRYLLKQLVYMKKNHEISKRLLSQIIGIATQPIVTTTPNYFILILQIFVEYSKTGLSFPNYILEIILGYFKHNLKEIYELNETMLFHNLNTQFNRENKILNEYTEIKDKLPFFDYAFILKYALCLKKYDLLSKEVKQILIDILINQYVLKEISEENEILFEKEGTKEVTDSLDIHNDAIFSVLKQFEEDYDAEFSFPDSTPVYDDNLFIQLDLFKAFLFLILFDDKEIVPDKFKDKKIQLREEIERFELRMREFLRDHLINKYGDEWFTKGVPIDIQTEIEKGIERDTSKEPYNTRANPLYKCTIKNYQSIITVHNWETIFTKNFPSKSYLEIQFENLNTFRNELSHTDPNISEHMILGGEAAIKWFQSMLKF